MLCYLLFNFTVDHMLDTRKFIFVHYNYVISKNEDINISRSIDVIVDYI